jgi:hypothetical protein
MLAIWMKLLPVWLVELIAKQICERVRFHGVDGYTAFKDVVILEFPKENK